MADWPTFEEVAQVLDVENTEAWETTLERCRLAAIQQVKEEVGHWDEYEMEPDEKLAAAALRLAELFATRPEATAAELINDPAYRRLITGRRRVFGFA